MYGAIVKVGFRVMVSEFNEEANDILLAMPPLDRLKLAVESHNAFVTDGQALCDSEIRALLAEFAVVSRVLLQRLGML